MVLNIFGLGWLVFGILCLSLSETPSVGGVDYWACLIIANVYFAFGIKEDL